MAQNQQLGSFGQTITVDLLVANTLTISANTVTFSNGRLYDFFANSLSAQTVVRSSSANASGFSTFRFQNQDASGKTFDISLGGPTATAGANSLYFYDVNAGVTRFFIGNGGNVGISNTTPAHTLSVSGTTYVSSNLTLADSVLLGTNIANSTGFYGGIVNAATLSAGATTIANSTGVYTGIVNAASYNTGTGYGSATGGAVVNTTYIAVGNSISNVFITSTTISLDDPTTGFSLANSSGFYTNGIVNASSINIGTADFTANSSLIVIADIPLSANGSNGFSGYILSSNGSTGAPYWASAGTALEVTRYINMSQPGTNAGPYTGFARFYPADNITVNQIFASVSQTPSASCIFKIFKNGVDTGYTFTINSGSNTLTPTSVSIIVATTDYLTINLVSGSFVDFRVQLAYS